ncbi:uncharacterized protein LOC111071663 [Drosophila obscura]|uniref:uncharacterized protein LOC111071663 n=1 Tax=Drosophila obscura TaxID=7282 RepID=UPI001BB24EB9|nr:uncharacterized protein LOC111071663 [Drosophila obscura]
MDSFEDYYSRICTLCDGVLDWKEMWPNHELTSSLFDMPVDEARNKLREAQAIAKSANRTIITLDDLEVVTNTQVSMNTRNRSKRFIEPTPPPSTRRLRTRLSSVNYCED